MDRCQNRCPARQHWPLPPTPGFQRWRQERWEHHQDHLQLTGMTQNWRPLKTIAYFPSKLIHQSTISGGFITISKWNLGGMDFMTFLDSDPLMAGDSMSTPNDLVCNPAGRVYSRACCSTGWIILFAASRFHQNVLELLNQSTNLAQLHRTKLPCILGKCPRTSSCDGKCMLSPLKW